MQRWLKMVVAAVAVALVGTAGAAPAPAPGKVDAAAAARMVSAYRASHGLPPVKVETHLMKIAAVHAQRMAAADQLAHVLPGEGSFIRRVKDGGYDPSVAAEDIGAGYSTLAEVMAGWQASPAHNANLLNRDVTEIGIAVYLAPNGKYPEYWALVLAKPAPPPPPPGSVVIGPFGLPLR